ncbi:MAG: hypothetical protein JRJ15_11765 [Deltaproteobacteria bacterium]|nr:hypothetical protein [Deltaproteobacteria bacterium]
MKYYIITFDRKLDANYGSFHDDFVGHPQMKRWFHYIKSSYIVGTSLSAGEISEHFTETAKSYGLPTTHLVMEVVLGERQGRLTKDAWRWLKKNTTGLRPH